MMADCMDGRMVMLMLASRAVWMAVRAARRTADYIAVTWVEWMIG